MRKTLILIESPGKIKKIESILGADYTVMASMGHIRDMPERSIGVAPPLYVPEYVLSEDKQRTIAAIKAAAAKADRVLLATDPDREGEAIAWHLAEVLGLKQPQRMTYQEITEKALRAALDKLRPIDMHRVKAQEARRVLDRLVGYEVSAPLGRVTRQKGVSAGRVQSPAVRLVVELERAIRAFKPTTHFGVNLRFPTPAPWTAEWNTKPHLADGQEYVLDAALAERVRSVTRVRVAAFADTKKASKPPAPLTTVPLQQRAQVALKFKPKKTMELAQNLFNQGAITYMRTDSPNLSDDAYNDIVGYARAHNLPLATERRTWKAKAGAQEGHEAIRPTHIDVLEAGETDQEKALYRLIWSRAVASQLADATFAVRTATLESLSPIDGTRHASYIARGKTLIDKGWKALYDEADEDAGKGEDNAGDSDNPIPELSIGAELDAERGELVNKTTKAPGRYSQTSLIGELEKHGIGRPATYASILDNIIKRGYIEEDPKGFLAATPLAEAIVDALLPAFQFIGLEYTRDLEAELDQIAEGKSAYVEVVGAAHKHLIEELARFAPAAPTFPCPACAKPMYQRTGAKGTFWACADRAGCGCTLPDDNGKPGARKERAAASAAPKASAHVCADASCGKPLRRQTKTPEQDTKGGKGYDFFGCTGWPKCKKTYKVSSDGTPIF